MLQNLRKQQKGFTIIEVLIVLAIAGLILLIVFLAVPALQRNSRNTSNKNDANAVAGAVNEFRSNNAGANPTTIAITAGVATVSGAGGTVPSEGRVNGSTQGVNANAATDTQVVAWQIGRKCNGDASNRAVAVRYWVERTSGGVGTQCVDA